MATETSESFAAEVRRYLDENILPLPHVVCWSDLVVAPAAPAIAVDIDPDTPLSERGFGT